jgi:hypothetical protein
MEKEQIKWHAQELCKLLEQEPSDPILASLCVDLESKILNNSSFRDVKVIPPKLDSF